MDPRFLEEGFIYIKVWGFVLMILSHFSSISHENETETKLFHFHRIFVYRGGEGGSSEPSKPPLDPSLGAYIGHTHA